MSITVPRGLRAATGGLSGAPRSLRRVGVGLLVGASLAGAAILGLRPRLVRVQGRSMEPTLGDGDRLLVLRTGPVRPGQLVAARDPRDPDRILVKRCVAAGVAGVTLRGDNAAASTDSRHFGPVEPSAVLGQVRYRYHPAQRSGPVASGGVASDG